MTLSKKVVSIFTAILLITAITACGSEDSVSSISPDTIAQLQQAYADGTITVDYDSAESFESALNDGADTTNKIVSFEATKVAPDSAVGFNVMAGEHLNFKSKDAKEISDHEQVTVIVTNAKSKIGSWFIDYELIGTKDLTAAEESPTSETSDETVAESENEEVPEAQNSEDYSSLSDIEKVDAFYKDYSSSKDIRELAEKYGLFVDSKSTGTGTKYYKVAPTKEEAKIISNTDKDKGTYFVLITEDQFKKTFGIQIVDNRESNAAETKSTPESSGTSSESSSQTEVAQSSNETNSDTKSQSTDTQAESTDNSVAAIPVPDVETSTSSGGNAGNADNFDTYDNPEQQQTEATYVLNTSTMKFHYPSCKSVKKISPDNYATSSASRDELISQGYDPCGNCKP